MPTTRTRVSRRMRQRITPEVIEAFRIMECARRQCACTDADHPYSCPACRRWWRAHSMLHYALGLPPWQFPAFAYPDERAEQPERHDLYAALVEAAKRADPTMFR
jgi:hypothetical protein